MSEPKYEIYDKLEVLSKEIKDRKRELNTEISKIDKEISDIRHYIEFYPLSASNGYKMAKMLKDHLVKRREIKNELDIMSKVQMMSVGQVASGKGREIIGKTLDKHYTPRVLRELFEQ
jgi:hypothetical protein